MPFEKGKNKSGGRKKGTKNKRTILKEKLGLKTSKEIDQFSPKLISNWGEFLNDKNKNVRFIATRDLSKLVFPSKKQIESTVKNKTIEDIVRESNAELSDLTVGSDGIKEK